MGKIIFPKKVCLVSAICFSEPELQSEALAKLVDRFGPTIDSSGIVEFNYTSYYDQEMGTNLQKTYYAFQELIDPITLADVKIFSNDIEDKFTENGQRLVNIDPGYIELAKLILATTKNFSHRIYIGKGIYGDVQLYWKGGGFKTNPWTYPDYKNDEIKSFFENIRMNYFNQIKGN